MHLYKMNNSSLGIIESVGLLPKRSIQLGSI